MKQKGKKQKRPIVFDKTAVIILIVFLFISIGTAIGVFVLTKNIISTWTMTSLEGIAVPPNSTDDPLVSETENAPSTNTDPVQLNPEIASEPWDGVSRVTVLLMGLDYRDWKAGDTPRTD